jgi:hypothetical protein
MASTMKPINPTDATLVSLHAHDREGKMHPDGMPWRARCRDVAWDGCWGRINCVYIDGRLTADDTRFARDPFPCWHRTEDGFYRICAGWAGHHGRK